MTNNARSEKEMKENATRRLKHATDPTEKLRLQCLKRGVAGIKGLGRMFLIIDDSGNKKIELPEFIKGLHDYGLDIEGADAEALFQQYDSDGSGSIDYSEFLLALRPPMSAARLSMVEKAFNKLDATDDGIVTVADLKGVYDVRKHPKFISGEMSEEQIFKEFLRSFEVGGELDGKVTRDEFFNYYAGVSASIDTDCYFDLMMRNAWKL